MKLKKHVININVRLVGTITHPKKSKGHLNQSKYPKKWVKKQSAVEKNETRHQEGAKVQRQSEAPNPLDAQVLLGVAVVAQAAHALEIQSGRTLEGLGELVSGVITHYNPL